MPIPTPLTSEEEKLSNYTETVRADLPQLGWLTEKDVREMIARYTAAIEGNFIPWLSATLISVKSREAKEATKINLEAELKEKHPLILREFARSADAEPSGRHYQAVARSVKDIWDIVGQLSGIHNVALMAVAENTSPAFIPYLEKLAKKRNSLNLEYTQIHGVADIQHAEDFTKALSAEMKYHERPYEALDQIAFQWHRLLINNIFLY